MEIGAAIKALRIGKGLTQEQLAELMNVSAQTVSRWETEVNYPDITILPALASVFEVSADRLLGIKGGKAMPKLIKTVETFELETRAEAEEMVMRFKSEKFPLLKEHRITEKDGKFILEVTKEFGMDLGEMKFDK